jgi:hypothetical protein
VPIAYKFSELAVIPTIRSRHSSVFAEKLVSHVCKFSGYAEAGHAISGFLSEIDKKARLIASLLSELADLDCNDSCILREIA